MNEEANESPLRDRLRAQGYERCQADVVAYLRNCPENASGPKWVAHRIEEGAHVGAAKGAK